ncbi:MAG: hypothetical protein NTX33_12840 [Propionibacteriales bacterium]|nr:hypothetical protein [Propionibacteriales bacterium]
MTRRSRLPFSGLLFALLATLLLVPLLGPAAQADPSDPAAPTDPAAAVSETPQEVAEQALETVEELLEPTAPVVDLAEGRSLTLALRDLAATQADLPTSRQDDAARLLSRPDGSDGGCDPYACWSPSASEARKCGTRVCVHWVRNTADKSSDAYATKALNVVNAVAERYKSAGYRVPINDGGAGGNWKVDVYLADLSDVGAFGYCSPDEDITTHAPASAYCVLDNNFAASEYGSTNTPTEFLQVTAAHEFFHAVQFAYDVLEDRWFMESTATWVEDEVYDNVNDNRFYLRYGPMGTPHRPLDTYSDAGLSQYGSWIFFRFLSERYDFTVAGIPVIVRRMWEAAAHSGSGAQGMYSVEAIRYALGVYDTYLSTEYSSFVARNREAKRYYEEGSAYPVAAPRGPYTLTAGSPAKPLTFALNHLSAKTLRYYPSSAMSKVWNLKIWLNLNSREAGGVAIVTIKPTGKASRLQRVSLDANGDNFVTVPFGSRVDYIEVSVVNASPRYTCGTGQGDTATCDGFSIDDNQSQVLNVRAIH